MILKQIQENKEIAQNLDNVKQEANYLIKNKIVGKEKMKGFEEILYNISAAKPKKFRLSFQCLWKVSSSPGDEED